MKTLLLFGSIVCATLSFGQTNLFTDDFESGTSNWTLNGGSGGNTWVVNNSYTGYTGLIPNTPNQPAGIGGSPNSNYLHIVNGSICTLLSACNANFDTGSASNQNAELTTSIDATSYTNVTVSFWYLCQGATGVSYGNLEYSIDGGTTWTSTGTEYSGTATWTQETVSLVAWNNVSAFKIRFKWQNGSSGTDPAFSIDDLVISGTPATPCPISIINTTITDETCGNSNGEVTVQATPSPLTYTLFDNSSNTQLSSNSTGNFTGQSAGNYYVVVSDGTCSDTTTTIAISNSGTAPNAGTNGLLTLCDSDNSVDLMNSLSGSPNTGGTWSPSLTSGTGMFDPSVDPSAIYTYTVSSTCGTASATVNVTVNTTPSINISPQADLCETNNPVTLSATPTGGVWSGSGITDVNLGTFSPSSAGAGSHQITYSLSGSCPDSSNITINVLPADDASFSYTTNNYCINDGNPSANISGVSGGTFSISPSGSINSTTGEVDLLGTGNGSFTITYNTTGACPSSSTFNLTISDQIAVEITPSGPFCENTDPVTLTSSVAGGTWSGTAIDGTSGSFNPQTAGAGTHQIIYTIGGNCGNADTIEIVVNPSPDVNAQSNQSIYVGEEATISASGASSYLWTPANGLSCTDCATPTASPTTTTVYTVTGTDANGCSDTAMVTIIVIEEEQDLFVPNIFSPNGDGQNDLFVVKGTGLNNYNLKVFNRWGELVFESDRQNISWDGTHNGKELNTAVFAYTLSYTDGIGNKKIVSGNVTLVK